MTDRNSSPSPHTPNDKPAAWTVNFRRSSVARWALTIRILLACRRFFSPTSTSSRNYDSDALASPALAAILTNPTWSLEKFRNILALRQFAKDSSTWSSASYADHFDRNAPPPLLLAILEPLIGFSDQWLPNNHLWQHLFWTLLGGIVDYGIAWLLEQIATSLLSSDSTFSNAWECRLQNIMSPKILPKLRHIFPLNTMDSNDDTNKLLTATNLPGLVGLLYWCCPATIISASECLCFQNLRVLLLIWAIHQVTCRQSIVSAAALLAVAVQTDSSLLAYGVPLILMVPSTQRQVGFLSTFVAVSAYLVFLTRTLLGPRDYLHILQRTLLSSHWPGTAPSLSIWWYTHMEVFHRFQTYFEIMMAGLPWLVVLPAAVRLHRYPLTMIAIYWWVWTILQPVSTLYDLTVAMCFLCLSPRSLARVNGHLFLIVMCALGVPVILFVLLYGMWMQVGNGEANFLFFQCLAYNIFLLILLLQFVHASVVRDKALCLTEEQEREKGR